MERAWVGETTRDGEAGRAGCTIRGRSPECAPGRCRAGQPRAVLGGRAVRASGAQAPTLRGAPLVCRSEAVPCFLPGGCTRAPRERRQWPATNLTPGALSRGLGSSHRCRLASGTALCRQAPVPRWPTQAPSASEVAPLRKTRKVWCISGWTFRHGAAAGLRVPPVALPSRTLRKKQGLSYRRGMGPERLSISTETFLGGISVWRRARALPRDPGLELVEDAW